MTLNDPEWQQFLTIRSIVRPLCGGWPSCYTEYTQYPRTSFKRHFSRSSNELQTVEWYTISWLTFAARRYAYRDLCRRASVRLSSVTFVYWKRNKRIVKLFLSRIAPCTILVFFRTKWQYLDWDPLTGASNTGGYKKNIDFSTSILLYLGNNTVWCGKTRMVWLPDGEESLRISRFDRIPACDRQTDKQTDILRQYIPRYA